MELFGVGEWSLHGMIWSTRFFFMLVGRFPVLMFSFIMRTLVSFWQTEGGKTYPKSESLCSAVPLMVLGRAHFLRWCIKEQNNIFFFFYEWNKVGAGDAAHSWQMASPCKLLVVIYVSAARSATLGKYSRKTYRCRGRGVMETIHYWLKCLGGVSAFLPTLNSSSRPSLSWGALVLWSLCRWPSREHTSSSVSPYRKYSSRAW